MILINTCGFIKDAKEESIEEILKLVGYKRRGSKQSRQLLVFGCLAQRYRDDLLKEIPEIDAIWGVGQEKEIIEYCKRLEARAESLRRMEAKLESEKKKFGGTAFRCLRYFLCLSENRRGMRQEMHLLRHPVDQGEIQEYLAMNLSWKRLGHI